HQTRGARDIGRAPGFEEVTLAAESAGAERERRYAQARGPKTSIFHGAFLWRLKTVAEIGEKRRRCTFCGRWSDRNRIPTPTASMGVCVNVNQVPAAIRVVPGNATATHGVLLAPEH